MGNCIIIGRRGRNLWRDRQETGSFSAAEGSTFGATNRRRLYSRPAGRYATSTRAMTTTNDDEGNDDNRDDDDDDGVDDNSSGAAK
eukprot:5749429-Pyramimonas_sp.AAC.1